MPDQAEIETKIAFLEKHIAELSDVVYEQQQAIDLLERKLKRFEQLATQDSAVPETAEQSKPPHY